MSLGMAQQGGWGRKKERANVYKMSDWDMRDK